MITGEEFIQLANRWAALPLQTGGGEAVWRTSICRAYYGAFHLGQGFLIGLGIKVPEHNAHDFVHKALKQSGNADIEKAGKLLADLRDNRTEADYEISVTEYGQQPLAQECHFNATKIDSLLKTSGSIDRETMRDRIKKWQRDVMKMPT